MRGALGDEPDDVLGARGAPAASHPTDRPRPRTASAVAVGSGDAALVALPPAPPQTRYSHRRTCAWRCDVSSWWGCHPPSMIVHRPMSPLRLRAPPHCLPAGSCPCDGDGDDDDGVDVDARGVSAPRRCPPRPQDRAPLLYVVQRVGRLVFRRDETLPHHRVRWGGACVRVCPADAVVSWERAAGRGAPAPAGAKRPRTPPSGCRHCCHHCSSARSPSSPCSAGANGGPRASRAASSRPGSCPLRHSTWPYRSAPTERARSRRLVRNTRTPGALH